MRFIKGHRLTSPAPPKPAKRQKTAPTPAEDEEEEVDGDDDDAEEEADAEAPEEDEDAEDTAAKSGPAANAKANKQNDVPKEDDLKEVDGAEAEDEE